MGSSASSVSEVLSSSMSGSSISESDVNNLSVTFLRSGREQKRKAEEQKRQEEQKKNVDLLRTVYESCKTAFISDAEEDYNIAYEQCELLSQLDNNQKDNYKFISMAHIYMAQIDYHFFLQDPRKDVGYLSIYASRWKENIGSAHFYLDKNSLLSIPQQKQLEIAYKASQAKSYKPMSIIPSKISLLKMT